MKFLDLIKLVLWQCVKNMSLEYWVYCFLLVGVLSVFTWRHGDHIGVPKQWNGGHVGVPSVPNQSRGSWTFFLCKNFLLLRSFA